MNFETFKKQFGISDNGFLPQYPPINKLPDQYGILNDIFTNLSVYIKENTLYQRIDILPIYSFENNKSINQKAYAMYCLIAHAWLWHHKNVPQIIPKQLSVPWCELGKLLGIVPVLTHAAVDMYNWKLTDPSGEITLDNLRTHSTITGTLDEEWFFLVMTEIEALGGPILKSIFQIVNGYDIIGNLKTIKTQIDKMTNVLVRMKEKCNPFVFYNILRPYLSGWTDKNLFPNGGIIYEDVSDTPICYVGGSGAQSSLIQAIDIFFGIHHKSEYFTMIRKYMPNEHQEFLCWLENVDIPIRDDTNESIKIIINDCIKSIKKFRMCHRKLISNYILGFIKDENNAIGSGGTELVSFIDNAIQETK